MKKLKILLLLACIYAQSINTNAQNLNASSSLHDSLEYLLTYLHDTTTDQRLKQFIEEAQALYKKDEINDSFAAKLINTEDAVMAVFLEN
ncbi:MAG: hypothetical protein ABJA79_03415 [Parafilimonas sp.]